jgi:hypothetical protein
MGSQFYTQESLDHDSAAFACRVAGITGVCGGT